jgi:hypothetical protein
MPVGARRHKNLTELTKKNAIGEGIGWGASLLELEDGCEANRHAAQPIGTAPF